MNRYIIAVTGASGSIYAQSLINALLDSSCEIFLVVSETGKKVIEYELNCTYDKWIESFVNHSNFNVESPDNMFSSISSGSYKTNGMVILPCSMGTLGRISAGTGDNLIIRAADVCLKERRTLICCVRESPYNEIHLINMLKLSRAGSIILPLSPGFYQKPKSIENIINNQTGKILDMLDIENNLLKRWN